MIKSIFRFFILLLLFNVSSIHAQPTVGLIQNSPAAFEGYTLFSPRAATKTYLIDINGLLVHTWDHAYGPGHGVYLLENGNLLRSSTIPDENGGNGGFQEIDWNGNIVREVIQGRQHHDIEYLPGGNVLLILNDVRTGAEAIEAGRNPDLVGNNIRLLKIIEVDSDSNKVVWEWNLWDHLIQEYDENKANYGIVAEHPELMDFNFASNASADWLHTNSIDYNADLDQILVSNRAIGELWIIDHSTTTEEAASHSGGNSGKGGNFLYRWGNPAAYQKGSQEDQTVFESHDAQWIEDGLNGAGNILIFNNGVSRPNGAYSSIDEFTPPVDESGNYTMQGDSVYGPDSLTWTYDAEQDTNFYSPRLSGVQRLPNGNTLICTGAGGKFFEVTADGEIVWEYINPVSGEAPVEQGTIITDNDVARCLRYSADYPGLSGKDLTPGNPIELTATGIRETNNLPYHITLYNYPNPFNPETIISYQLSMNSDVELSVYNTLGQKLATLVKDSQQAGHYTVSFNASQLSSGVYYYRMKINGNFVQTKKMTFLK
jgi:hypothetical protein